MNNWLRITAVVVVMCFIYSNIVWAGGLPTETLAQDPGGILAGLFSKTDPAGMQDGYTAFKERPGLNKRLVFSQLADAVRDNSANTGLLDVYKQLLFSIFGDELKSIDERKVVVSAASDNKIGFFLI